MKCHHAKHRDGQQRRDARNRVVHAGSHAGLAFTDRIHHRGCERRHNEAHSQAKDDHRREVCGPITSADTRLGEQKKSARSNHGPDNEREFCAIVRNQAASPSGKKKQDQNQRQIGRASLRRRIALHLDQIVGKEEE
jgi:hypothetical protein